MPLTDAQKTAVEEWIKSRAAKFGCPACGTKVWGIQDELAFPGVIDVKTNRTVSGAGFPLAVLTCNHCGYTTFFSAAQIGLIK